ncbi:hypothetical protein NLJ89_g9985 [Agrocybe chaxingu]|uniref:Uncharacterized protein n=1 Tax=Agrocybe chaxingu TaxID=84603 RepID=A0A9W8MQP9_9AGAR|nr:hypothetical protein NLJ89_g9985 [Agrocybe chaxingu]
MSFLPLATFLSASSSSRHRQSATSRSCAPSSVTDLGIDVETAALIAKLQLEDLEDTLSRRKGKGRAGAVPSDEEYALQVQREQYEELLRVAEDAKIATSLRGAVETDIAYIEALMLAEEAAREDRRAAEMLSRGERLPPQKDCQIRLENPGFIMHPEPPKLAVNDEASEKTLVDSDDEDALLSDDDDSTVFGDFAPNKQAAIVNDVKIRNSFSKKSTPFKPLATTTTAKIAFAAWLNCVLVTSPFFQSAAAKRLFPLPTSSLSSLLAYAAFLRPNTPNSVSSPRIESTVSRQPAQLFWDQEMAASTLKWSALNVTRQLAPGASKLDTPMTPTVLSINPLSSCALLPDVKAGKPARGATPSSNSILGATI